MGVFGRPGSVSVRGERPRLDSNCCGPDNVAARRLSGMGAGRGPMRLALQRQVLLVEPGDGRLWIAPSA